MTYKALFSPGFLRIYGYPSLKPGDLLYALFPARDGRWCGEQGPVLSRL